MSERGGSSQRGPLRRLAHAAHRAHQIHTVAQVVAGRGGSHRAAEGPGLDPGGADPGPQGHRGDYRGEHPQGGPPGQDGRPGRPGRPEQPAERPQKPNILVFWGDDIGLGNISCYSHGVMGYRTPNIDRLAAEGVMFTDCYAEQSCTAGRASLWTGQHGLRTGLVRVGMPGDKEGISFEDPTLAELLKPLGYRCGQFGKNHFGDRNEHLPTVHGWDEFLGNLYHLNAEQEPQHADYPKDPRFKDLFGPRGVLDCLATDEDDATVDPRWGRVGRQKITDTGPLSVERMRTCDDEFVARAAAFIRQNHDAKTPWLCHVATTHMHYFTWLRATTATSVDGQYTVDAGQDRGGYQHVYSDVMEEHDKHVGQMLELLDELGIAGSTIVLYSTDNGPHINEFPDCAMTPFRSEKNTNWEGAYRVPSLIRWSGVIPAGQVLTGIVSHLDWVPTLMSAAGEPDIAEKLKTGHTISSGRGRQPVEKTYKVHLDGYDLLPYLTGAAAASPRVEFIYCNDDREITGLRVGPWKFNVKEQRLPGTMGVWAEPMVTMRRPKFWNLRIDPYERADITSNMYWYWMGTRAFVVMPAIAFLVNWAQTFKEFPPRILGHDEGAVAAMTEEDNEIVEGIAEAIDGLKYAYAD